MKKNILIGVIMVAITLGDLVAQEKATIRPASQKSLESLFQGATNLRWERVKSLDLARFNYQGSAWLAFFDHNGALVTKGRKIQKIDELPVTVYEGMLRAKHKYEKKYGVFTYGVIFELIQGSNTDYFVPMINDKATLNFMVSAQGMVTLKSRSLHEIEPRTTKEVIAKKN